MSNCSLTPCYKQYVVYPSSTVGTVTYYNSCICKLCNLATGSNVLIKVGVLPTTATDTIVLVTKCGGTLPLFTSAGAAVTGSQLVQGLWYQLTISRNNGVPSAVVNGI